MPTGAELFVVTLQSLGISEIFTLVGDHLNEVLTVAARAGLRIIDMRHESAVVHAADTWARLHRRPAVSLVTGGPGHTNSLTGITTAHLMGTPLITVSGSRATTWADRGAFQDLDQVSMVRPVVKWAAEPAQASQIPFYLARAYAEASAGRPGVVHLTIPVNLFTADAEQSPNPSGFPAVSSPPGPDRQQAEQAVELLRGSERPVVIAGGGVWWSGAEQELLAFIERTSLPLFTITLARGAVSDEHPLCFGYGDPALSRAAQHAFVAADTVLVLGKRIDYRLAFGGQRMFSPTAQFIQVDIHRPELGINRVLAVAICADLRATLNILNDITGEESWPTRPWLEQLRSWRREWTASLASRAEGRESPLHPAVLFSELDRCLPKKAQYSWDGGDFVHWGRSILPARHAGGWQRLGPLAAIGGALPNAIAMKLARPDVPVVMITGDGAFGFYLAEVDTAVRLNLPLIMIIGNDGGWGLERELQTEAYQGTVACDLRRTRYDLIVKGFGGDGELVETVDQIAPAMERAMASEVPYCINVTVRGVRSPFTEWQVAGKRTNGPSTSTAR